VEDAGHLLQQNAILPFDLRALYYVIDCYTGILTFKELLPLQVLDEVGVLLGRLLILKGGLDMNDSGEHLLVLVLDAFDEALQ